jgi:hypothetical protein
MTVSSSKLVFLSSWSSVFSNRFKTILFDKNIHRYNNNIELLKAVTSTNDNNNNEHISEKYKLIYVPTAKFAYDSKGQKSKGEQRRFDLLLLNFNIVFY